MNFLVPKFAPQLYIIIPRKLNPSKNFGRNNIIIIVVITQCLGIFLFSIVHRHGEEAICRATGVVLSHHCDILYASCSLQSKTINLNKKLKFSTPSLTPAFLLLSFPFCIQLRKEDPKITVGLVKRTNVLSTRPNGARRNKELWKHLLAVPLDRLLTWSLETWIWRILGASLLLSHKDDILKKKYVRGQLIVIAIPSSSCCVMLANKCRAHSIQAFPYYVENKDLGMRQ